MNPMRNTSSSTHDKITRSSWNWVIGACLVAVTLLVYLPVWHAGFIMDDDINITGNSCVSGPLGLGGIWSSRAADYFPLTLTSFWFLHALWGDSPLPYHLLTLLFHVADTLLLWRVLSCLDVRGAWIGASLWALHPVQVESVAWVSELKNTQSAFFYLASILGFLHWRGMTQEGRRGEAIRAYTFALLCGLLAMLSKSSTVMLPAVLSLCWWWREKNWRIRDTLQLAPFFLASLAFALWTISSEKIHAGAVGKIWDAGVGERLIMAGRAFWFYLGKLLWPAKLSFIYPRWEMSGGSAFEFAVALIPLLCMVALLIFLYPKMRHPWIHASFFAFAYFTISLFPILGFFDVAFFRLSRVADHFQYLASMGPLSLAGAGLMVSCEGVMPLGFYRLFRCNAAILLSGLLAILSFNKCQEYKSPMTLWRATILNNPRSPIAHNNLGFALWQSGDLTGFISELNTALSIDPNCPDALNNMGKLMLQRGDMREGLEYFTKSLSAYERNSEAENNIGSILSSLGNSALALPHFYKALKMTPENMEVENNLGNTLLQTGQLSDALMHLQRAVSLNPHYAVARYNLGRCLLLSGRQQEALAQLQESVNIDSSNSDAHNMIGSILGSQGLSEKAIHEFEKAVALQPTNTSYVNNLAWVLTTAKDPTLRNGVKALALIKNANQLGNNSNPSHLRTLAAAYAENGQFRAALQTINRAITLAENNNNPVLATSLRLDLKKYKTKDESINHHDESVDGLIRP
jgi:tetratricopeptide (TPR) repeat protein